MWGRGRWLPPRLGGIANIERANSQPFNLSATLCVCEGGGGGSAHGVAGGGRCLRAWPPGQFRACKPKLFACAPSYPGLFFGKRFPPKKHGKLWRARKQRFVKGTFL